MAARRIPAGSARHGGFAMVQPTHLIRHGGFVTAQPAPFYGSTASQFSLILPVIGTNLTGMVALSSSPPVSSFS